MTISEVSAVVLTKGDRDISVVTDSLREFGEVRTPVGSPDTLIEARYHSARCARFDVIALQDDDTIVDWAQLVALYQPGKLVCNMPPPWRDVYGHARLSMVGFGAIADRSMFTSPFDRYFGPGLPRDEVFLRECDRVFTGLLWDKTVWVDVPITRLPVSFDESRMYRQGRQHADWIEILRRLDTIR